MEFNFFSIDRYTLDMSVSLHFEQIVYIIYIINIVGTLHSFSHHTNITEYIYTGTYRFSKLQTL